MNRAPTLSRVHELGGIIGRIHRITKNIKVTHRRYWDAEGLVGKNPKFGSVEHVPKISAENQQVLSRYRRLTFDRLLEFQKKFPHKQGLIHADLHFGNIFAAEDGLAVIDFDDCGFGFHAYDLAIPLMTMEFWLRSGRKREFPKFRETLIEGYATEMNWDEHDQELLPYLTAARRLVMLGWILSRSDHPKLRRLLQKSVVKTVRNLQKQFPSQS
jgi:Ser/Thr protein kinase RdoA (MazF antagonist)